MSSEKPSKSALKREHAALQALGEQLIDYDEHVLKDLPLEDDVLEAILEARAMRSHGALRRQKQLIGKLMAGSDAEALRAALDALNRVAATEKKLFATAERWRDRIIREREPAVAEFEKFLRHPDPDLHTLVQDLARCASDRDDKRLRRTIFRHIHQALVDNEQDDSISR